MNSFSVCRQVPGLKPHTRKRKRRPQRQAPDSSDDDAVNEILLQWRAEQAEQIAERSATDTVSMPTFPGQQRRLERNQEIETPPPPLPVRQAAHNQHNAGRPVTHTVMPQPPLPIRQVPQSHQVHRRSATRGASPSPSPVQQSSQGQGPTQYNTEAYEDSDDTEARLSPSPDSRRLPPKFLARSHIIVDSPRSDRQHSPPLDAEDVGKRRRQRIMKSMPRAQDPPSQAEDPPSHPPHARAKKLTLRVPPRRK